MTGRHTKVGVDVVLAVALALGLVRPAAAGAEAMLPAWEDVLPLEATRVRTFLAAHPTWDGRAVYVAVLDEGVDPTAPGLEKTSTGAVKVVEARDFSGEGDVALEVAAREEGPDGPLWRTSSGIVRGIEGLGVKPTDGSVRVGFLDEARMRSAEGADANGNGRRDDRYALVVIRTGAGADDVIAVLDAGADGSVAGDRMVRPFHVAQELLRPASPDPKRQAANLVLAFEPMAEEHKAVLHFAAGSHGTHVAAIATGHRVFGHDGWQGVAPGARVLSLKIGASGLAGGATTTGSFQKALRFAARFARERKAVVIVNASYGIPSVTEGHSDIDRVIDEIIRDNSLVSMVFSAGNEGPGYSTVGTPAAASLGFAAGAFVPPATAKALYGATIEAPRLFPFSARGGEVAKPDAIAPGAAIASVQTWNKADHKHGTSMAAPQVAGAMALLWSGLVADGLHERAHAGLLKRALVRTARPLEGYNALEQGGGVIRVPEANEALRRLLADEDARSPVAFHVASSTPTLHGEAGDVAFWRTGAWAPSDPQGVKFKVRAVFAERVTKAERDAWEGVFDLEGKTGFARPTSRVVHLRGERESVVTFQYDASRLSDPGVHVEPLVARARGSRSGIGAFALVNAVVVPWRFDAAGDFERHWRDVRPGAGEVRRFFVSIPPGARRMTVAARAKEGYFAHAKLNLYDPAGHKHDVERAEVASESGDSVLVAREGAALTPGIWEVDVIGLLSSGRTSRVELDVSFSGLHAAVLRELSMRPGEGVRGEVEVTNPWDRPFVGHAEGEVATLARTHRVEVRSDRHEIEIPLDPSVMAVRLVVSMEDAALRRVTDAAMMVVDADGKVLVQGGLDAPRSTLRFENPGFAPDSPKIASKARTRPVKLVVQAAFTHPGSAPWRLHVEEEHRLVRAIGVEVSGPNGERVFTLYPNHPRRLRVLLPERPTMPPDGYTITGELRLVSSREKRRAATIPIRIDR